MTTGENFPNSTELEGFNVFILSFLLQNGDPSDELQNFVELTSEQQASIISDYHSAGISLMVSAFGSIEAPTSTGADPVDTANIVASFVQTYNVSVLPSTCELGIETVLSSMVSMLTTKTLTLSTRELGPLRVGLLRSLSNLDPNCHPEVCTRSSWGCICLIISLEYIITHAPVAPWFTTNTTLYPAGAYRTVNAEAGSDIDWYNLQVRLPYVNQNQD